MAAATHQPLRQDSHQYSYHQMTKHPLPPPSQVPQVRHMLPHPYSTQSPIPRLLVSYRLLKPNIVSITFPSHELTNLLSGGMS
jgi:hypothetical protein